MKSYLASLPLMQVDGRGRRFAGIGGARGNDGDGLRRRDRSPSGVSTRRGNRPYRHFQRPDDGPVGLPCHRGVKLLGLPGPQPAGIKDTPTATTGDYQ